MSGKDAIRYRGAGGVEVLEFGELPASHRRRPGRGEVAVRVVAVGLNRADVLQRRGLYPAPAGVEADVPGLELSGVVAEVGDAARFAIGDRVMGIVGGGAFSKRIVVRADELVAIPNGLDVVAAAAVPEAFFTAYDALIVQARLSIGERVLVHAVASGVGTAAVQIAKRAGAVVIGTSRSSTKLAALADLGLDHSIVCEQPLFAEAVARLSAGRGADVVLDLVGASYLDENVRALTTRGRMIILGLLGGIKAEAALGLILTKRLEIRGSVLRSRSASEKANLAARIEATLVPMFVARELVPVIERVMPMDEIGAAHELLESNSTTGKIVLTW